MGRDAEADSTGDKVSEIKPHQRRDERNPCIVDEAVQPGVSHLSAYLGRRRRHRGGVAHVQSYGLDARVRGGQRLAVGGLAHPSEHPPVG